MSGPAHDAPAPLPEWQAARLAPLLGALGGIPVSDAERASLTWLAGFEAHTVENITAAIHRARDHTSVLAMRVEPEVERLRQQLSNAVDEARSRCVEADRYRRQLADLCEEEGVEAGEDPHAALLAHLRRRREPPLHRPRPCPACGTDSRAIIDGRCLACRDPQRGRQS